MSTGLVNWDQPTVRTGSSSTDGGDRPTYLRLAGQAGQIVKYTVRPVHKPILVWKYFNQLDGKGIRSAVVEDPETDPVREKHPELEPKLKYASNVIDRQDGQIKILEMAPSIFEGFQEWASEAGINPGGEKGGDFVISVKLPKDGDKRRTKYACRFLKAAPFTEEEMPLLKLKPNGERYNLEDVYKPNSPEQMEKILFDIGKDKDDDDDGDAFGSDAKKSGGDSSKDDDDDFKF